MSIQVTGTNEVITFSSSQSTTDYTYAEKYPFGVVHSYGVGEDSFGYSTYGYGFVEHTLKEGTIHVN
ncbi:MAG: hypothetical protein ACOYJC_11635 [Christensenellales bacterium]|jgi:hypothetical protein